MENLIKLKSKQIEGGYLNFSLLAPEFVKRTPLNVCFVIDVSTKFIQEIEQLSPEFQFSFEEVLRNAIQPLLHPLSEHDRVSIVQASGLIGEELNHNLESVFSPHQMDEEGKKLAVEFLKNVKIVNEFNSTIDSVERALGILRDSANQSTQSLSPVVILISDVRVNKLDKENLNSQLLVSRVREFVQKNKALEGVSINTCGLSNNVDSYLLLDIAREFSGQFVFLEDFSVPEKFLSKVFANLITSYCTNVRLNVQLLNNSTFATPNPVSALLPNQVNSENTSINVSVGPLQYSQTREIILKLAQPISSTTTTDVVAKVTITYDVSDNSEKTSLVKKSQSHDITVAELPLEKTSVELQRVLFADYVYSNIKKYQNGIQSYAISALTNLVTILEKNSSLSPYVSELAHLVQLHLETTFSNEKTFSKNRNSLLTLVRSHILQLESIAHPSLEYFKNRLQSHYIKVIEEAHAKLPSPLPSPKKSQQKHDQQSFIKVKAFDMYEIYECTRI